MIQSQFAVYFPHSIACEAVHFSTDVIGNEVRVDFDKRAEIVPATKAVTYHLQR